eukprot:CAMPEP_0198576522 /NCGR_PEP_ID=MMETSP1462-20131121/117706_1 /TAXON_ID=1333877 /ORGANISM="Brandtodinium nutriculum, Strain RCC3387" /LENGTH=59 /DNA_ID=CAMNT_0044307785 /DNA_START=23 /DNA_END=199 /DNA_ORIENTATION=+
MTETASPDQLAGVIELLLAHGAPPDEVDEDGDTALRAVIQLSAEVDRDGDESPASKEAS